MQRGAQYGHGAHTTHVPVKAPFATELCRAQNESEDSADVSELRAYKLGKKRWSYNQCALSVLQRGGSKELSVVDATSCGANKAVPRNEQESAVAYTVSLSNGKKVMVVLYAVFNDAHLVHVPGALVERRYLWDIITRSQCSKGCSGPILRAIQRFGRQGRRAVVAKQVSQGPRNNSTPSRSKINKALQHPPQQQHSDSIKDGRYLYVSIDEATTHVGKLLFRLLAGVYNADGSQLLGTGLSAPIRVLCNNDVPSGAAYIPLEVTLLYDWEGWGTPEVVNCQTAERTMTRLRSEEVAQDANAEAQRQLDAIDRLSNSSSDNIHPSEVSNDGLAGRHTHQHQGGVQEGPGLPRGDGWNIAAHGLPPPFPPRQSIERGRHPGFGAGIVSDGTARGTILATRTGNAGASLGGPPEHFASLSTPQQLVSLAALGELRNGGPRVGSNADLVAALGALGVDGPGLGLGRDSPPTFGNFACPSRRTPASSGFSGLAPLDIGLPSPGKDPINCSFSPGGNGLSGGFSIGAGEGLGQILRYNSDPAPQTDRENHNFNFMQPSVPMINPNERWTYSPGVRTSLHRGQIQQRLQLLQHRHVYPPMQRTRSVPLPQIVPGQQLDVLYDEGRPRSDHQVLQHNLLQIRLEAAVMQPGPGTLFPRSGPSVSNSYAHPQPPMRGNVHLYDALARAQEMQSSQQAQLNAMLGIVEASSPMVADVEPAKAIPTAPAAGERMPSHNRGGMNFSSSRDWCAPSCSDPMRVRADAVQWMPPPLCSAPDRSPPSPLMHSSEGNSAGYEYNYYVSSPTDRLHEEDESHAMGLDTT